MKYSGITKEILIGDNESKNSKHFAGQTSMEIESDFKLKADILMEKAKSILQKKSKFWKESDTNRKKTAIKLIMTAVDFYKNAGISENTGYALLEAGKIIVELNKADFDTAMIFKDAVICLQNSDVSESIVTLSLAENIFINKSCFKYAAQCNEFMGELYAKINLNLLALNSYKIAVIQYESDLEYLSNPISDLRIDISNCYYNIIHLLSIEKLYEDIIFFSEKYADTYNSMIVEFDQYNKSSDETKEVCVILLNVILYNLGLYDLARTNKKIDEYLNKYSHFNKSSEYIFMTECIDAYRQADLDFYLNIINNFNINACQKIAFKLVYKKLLVEYNNLTSS